MTKRAALAGKLLIAGAILGWLSLSGNLGLEGLRGVGERWPWILLAQVPFAGVAILSALRLRLLLESYGIPASFSRATKLTLLGWLASQVLFGTTGGDALKAGIIAVNVPGRRARAVVVVLLDRVLGVFGLLALFVLAVPWNLDTLTERQELRSTVIAAVLLFGILALVGIAGLWCRGAKAGGRSSSGTSTSGYLGRVAEGLLHLRRERRVLLLCLLATLAMHLLSLVAHLFLARAVLKEPPSLGSLLLVVPLAQILMALPFNPPGALGTGEALYAFLLALAGVPQGAILSLLLRLTYTLWGLAGAFAFAVAGMKTPPLDLPQAGVLAEASSGSAQGERRPWRQGGTSLELLRSSCGPTLQARP